MSAIWQNAVITKKGLALQAKTMTGGTVKITSVKTGSGVVPVGSLEDQTAVSSIEQTCTIRSIKSDPDDVYTAVAEIMLSNKGLSASYGLNQVGFYANDPDSGEILYAIAQATTAKEIPSESEMPGYSLVWHFYFNLSSEINMAAEVTPADLVSVEMLEDAITEATFIKGKSGELLLFTDSSGYHLTGLKVYGKIVQEEAPRPDAIQELESIGAGGEVAVKICGKNVLSNDGYTYTQHGITFTKNSDGSIHVSGTATERVTNIFTYMPRMKKGEKYILSGCPTGGSKSTYMLRCYNIHGDDNVIDDIGEGIEFEYTNSTGVFNSAIIVYPDVTIDKTFYPMIRHASVEDNTYEIYSEQTLAVDTTDGLPGVPAVTGGNYTDSDGQQWICDEIDFERGVYVQRIKEFVASEACEDSFTVLGNTARFNVNLPESAPYSGGSPFGYGLCSHLPFLNAYSNDSPHFYTQGAKAWMYLPVEYGTTLEEINEWLSANTVTIAYQLATPVETDLSAEQLSAYAGLHTNKPSTTILNDSGAEMMVKYMRDCRDSDYVSKMLLKRTDVVDNLESDADDLPLSARMGKELNTKILSIYLERTTVTMTEESHAITAPSIDGRVFMFWITAVTESWVGSVYIENPAQANTNVWKAVGAGGTVHCYAVYRNA